VVIAFFNVSEMGLMQFIAKLIRTNLLDTPKKFQDDYERIDPVDVVLKKARANDDQQKTNIKKTSEVNEDKLNKLKKDTLF